MSDKKLVYYPGHHGRETATTMRNSNRGMRWTAGQVRLVPALEASDYVRLGGYHYALTTEEVQERFGLTPQALTGRRDKLTTATYTPEGGEEQAVYVLDQATARALRGLAAEGPPPIPDDFESLEWPDLRRLGAAYEITGKKENILAGLAALRQPAVPTAPANTTTTTDNTAPEA